jgi:hypothetical protein
MMSQRFPSKLYAFTDRSVLALYTRFEKGGMAQDQNARGSNKPEEGPEWTSPPKHGNANHEQSSIQMFLCDRVLANLCCLRSCSWM